MISRIETLDDLIIWLNSIATLNAKDVKLEKLPDDLSSGLIQIQRRLLDVKHRFPDPFKQCIKCQAIYPANKKWFDWNGRGRDGLNCICKFCRNAYQKKHKSKGHKSTRCPSDQQELESHFGPGAVY